MLGKVLCAASGPMLFPLEIIKGKRAGPDGPADDEASDHAEHLPSFPLGCERVRLWDMLLGGAALRSETFSRREPSRSTPRARQWNEVPCARLHRAGLNFLKEDGRAFGETYM